MEASEIIPRERGNEPRKKFKENETTKVRNPGDMIPISACPGVPWAEIVAVLVGSLAFQGMPEEDEARSYIRLPDVNDDQVRCFPSSPILLELTRARYSIVRTSRDCR